MDSFGLSTREKLKSRIEFEKLYTSGKVVLSKDKKIKAVYLFEKDTGSGEIKIAAVVSGKAGKAVWRNRLKRLLRTSYRLNKVKLYNLCTLKKIVLKIIFSPYRFNEKNNKQVMLDDIMPGVKDVLYNIERNL